MTLNNSTNKSMGLSPNEIVMGFKAREALSLVEPENVPEDRTSTREVYRRQASDAMEFAVARMKIQYDKGHKPLMIKPGEKVMLRLHHGYDLPGNPNRKFNQQRASPFEVEKRIGRNAYRLKLPPNWKVHSVNFIAQLEPVPKGPDPLRTARTGSPSGY
jgi:hypothetical protein